MWFGLTGLVSTAGEPGLRQRPPSSRRAPPEVRRIIGAGAGRRAAVIWPAKPRPSVPGIRRSIRRRSNASPRLIRSSASAGPTLLPPDMLPSARDVRPTRVGSSRCRPQRKCACSGSSCDIRRAQAVWGVGRDHRKSERKGIVPRPTALSTRITPPISSISFLHCEAEAAPPWRSVWLRRRPD